MFTKNAQGKVEYGGRRVLYVEHKHDVEQTSAVVDLVFERNMFTGAREPALVVDVDEGGYAHGHTKIEIERVWAVVFDDHTVQNIR